MGMHIRLWRMKNVFYLDITIFTVSQGRMQGGGFGGFKPSHPSKKIIILFRGFLMNLLHTEGQTVPNMP